MAVLQLPFVVRSMIPFAIENSEDRAAETWPCPSPTTAFGRVGPAPQLGSTVELALVVWVQVSQPLRHESGRASRTVCHAVVWVRER